MSSATHPAIQARGLGRRFGRDWALAHVDLDVAPGESMVLAGANGSGKTTLLRLAAGLYKPSRGQIRIYGLDPRRDRLACHRAISLVSHQAYLYDRLTALETLRVWARLLGRPAADSDLLPLLALVGLDRRPRLKVAGFSAGMRKRLTLLRTRLERPRLLLLDEPFSALDVEGKRQVEDWVHDAHQDGAAVVMASHAVRRAGRLCDRAVLLERGQIVWRGDGDELAERLGESA
jgi:ABC-2 type transport system ATP-binding protein